MGKTRCTSARHQAVNTLPKGKIKIIIIILIKEIKDHAELKNTHGKLLNSSVEHKPVSIPHYATVKTMNRCIGHSCSRRSQ